MRSKLILLLPDVPTNAAASCSWILRSIRSGAACHSPSVQKPADELRLWPLGHLAGRAHLFDATLVHDRYAVGDFDGLRLVVGHEDRGDISSVMNLAQPPAQFLADLGVERAERFVKQQDARLDGERASESDALLLPARQLRRIASA